MWWGEWQVIKRHIGIKVIAYYPRRRCDYKCVRALYLHPVSSPATGDAIEPAVRPGESSIARMSRQAPYAGSKRPADLIRGSTVRARPGIREPAEIMPGNLAVPPRLPSRLSMPPHTQRNGTPQAITSVPMRLKSWGIGQNVCSKSARTRCGARHAGGSNVPDLWNGHSTMPQMPRDDEEEQFDQRRED